MVYESDFYTVRRPYSSRVTPTISSYSVSTVPGQITKYLPGVGKVYVVNTYPRYINTYTSPKRITYYSPSQVVRLRPSSYMRELDRIEHKYRTSNTYSYLNDYLSSPSATVYMLRTMPRYIYPYGGSKRLSYYTPSSVYSVYLDELTRLEHELGPLRTHSYISDYWNYASTFDDEKRAIRAQSNALLQRVHTNVPRVTVRVVPFSSPYSRYQESPLPIRISSDAYIQRMVQPVRRVADNILNISYYSEPAKRFIGPGHLACIRFAGDKAYNKRKHVSDLTDQVIRNDINLLSYYLKNRQAAQTGAIEAPIKVTGLSSCRPTRVFTTQKLLPDPADEKREVEALKAANKAKAIEEPQQDASAKLSEKKRKQIEEKEAEERALAEEQARQKAQAKKDEEARQAELERQAEIEKQRLLEEEAEREAQRMEKARKEAEERQAAELAKQEEELRVEAERLEAERVAAERLEAERLEQEQIEAAKKAEEERLEAERLESERKAEEARLEEERRQEELAHLAEISKQAEEAKDAELQRQAEELAEIARQESELAKQELQKDEVEEDNAIAEAASAEDEADAGNESADEQAEIEESAEAIVEEPIEAEVVAKPSEEVVEDEEEEEEEEEEE